MKEDHRSHGRNFCSCKNNSLIQERKIGFLVKNKNRQKAILTGMPIFLGEGVAAHLGHQGCRWPLRNVASDVRVKQVLICTLLDDFRNKKNEYQF